MRLFPFRPRQTAAATPSSESDVERVRRDRIQLLTLAAGVGLLASAEGDAGTSERRNPGRNRILGGGGLHHTTVRTNDWDRTLKFYEQVLGFTTLMNWNEHT